MMEITDLKIQVYSKVVDLSALLKPELLSQIKILNKKDYSKDIQCFDAADRNGNRYQLYVCKLVPEKCIDKAIFLGKTPKFLFLRGDPLNIVLESRVHDRLDNYLVYYDSKQSPYLQEPIAKNILLDVTESLEDFCKNSIQYDYISPRNVVRIDQKWFLSSVGPILCVDKLLPEYYDKSLKGQQKLTYALGCLLFKLVFGFPPIDSSRKSIKKFSFSKYLQYLQTLQHMKSLKIYYYAERMLTISQELKKLIEESLSGSLTLREWKEHTYFLKEVEPMEIQNRKSEQIQMKSKEIQMINLFGIENCSLILSAIEHKSKHPLERLNPKSLSHSEELSEIEVIESYRKNHILKHLDFQFDCERKEMAMVEEQVDILPSLAIDYFFQDTFDPEQDYPCRQLIKLIEQEKQEHPERYKKNNDRQYKLKMYGYPYAMAFQLVKVQKSQPLQIKRIIKKTIQLLLQLSSLLYPGQTNRLHLREPKYKKFQQMKGVFREHINELYRYFLSEAMRKYNSKKEATVIEKSKQKEKGLEYYRLCLKLMEVSLIVRKEGRDLDLGRIETSQRKEIESDLSALLKQYFPNKAEMN